MNNTCIFVSSTCYDLAAVRESIREMILDLGHEPLLSEYPSFPVNPDENAIANCRRNVREHSDILVLIVGGRRGSLDPTSGKPVTNLEYDEALRCGVPVYVFVSRTVNDLLHVWKQNPDTNLAPTVDYPQVFTFIEQIRAAGIWTFSFDRTADIKETLRGQLSSLLRDLLARRKGGRLDSLPEFTGESKQARELALDRPKYWEFHLVEELLDNRMSTVLQRQKELRDGFIYRPFVPLKASEVIGWFRIKGEELTTIITQFDPAYKSLMDAMGPSGQPGDAVLMLKAANRVRDFAEEVVNWEVEVLRVRPPERFQKLVQLVAAMKAGILEDIASVPQQIRSIFADNPAPKGEFNIVVKLTLPGVDAVIDELEHLQNIPNCFQD